MYMKGERENYHRTDEAPGLEFQKLICLSEDTSWSLLAATALKTPLTICFTKAACSSIVLFNHICGP